MKPYAFLDLQDKDQIIKVNGVDVRQSNPKQLLEIFENLVPNKPCFPNIFRNTASSLNLYQGRRLSTTKTSFRKPGKSDFILCHRGKARLK